MFSAIKGVFTGENITRYSAVVPQSNAPVLAVSVPKSGYVKIPLGLPPGSVFYYKEKEIFQLANPPRESSEVPPASVFTQPSTQSCNEPVMANVVTVNAVGGSQGVYNSSAYSNSSNAVVYENNATTTGYVSTSQQPPKAATYRVEVPLDARPGQTFHCVINNEKIAIVVPPGALPGNILTLQGPPPINPSAPPLVIAEYADIPIATIVYYDGQYFNGYTGPIATQYR